jgi:hypothetical protein
MLFDSVSNVFSTVVKLLVLLVDITVHQIISYNIWLVPQLVFLTVNILSFRLPVSVAYGRLKNEK